MSAAEQRQSRPNIVLILCDDLGYADVGFNAEQFGVKTDVVTPNIDALARAGTIFTIDATLIVFLSDNGGKILQAGNNAPLLDDKGSTHEGGIRVPMFMHWPGQTSSGTVFEHPVLALDFYPTFAGLAKASISNDKQLDGKNIWADFLAGRNPHHDETMFWLRHHGGGNEVAVRRGDLKAYRKNFGKWQLFDVGSDVGESTDIAKQHADFLSRRIAEGAAWADTHIEPQWHDTEAGLESWLENKMPKYDATFTTR